MTVIDETSYDYDDHGRLKKTILTSDATDYAVTQYNYDSVNRLQCKAVRMDPTKFGSLPGPCSLTSPVGAYGEDRITRTYYDDANRLNKVERAYSTSIVSEETLDYTDNGLIANVYDGNGNRTHYEYDGFDRLKKRYYPSETTAGSYSSSDYDEYTYNDDGTVATWRNRAGKVWTNSYDALSRLTARSTNGTGDSYTYTYDNLSRLLSVAISGHTNSFTYDALSRLLTASSSEISGSVSYQYDLAGRRTRMTYPDGFYVDYDYHVGGGVTAIRENGATSGAGVLAEYSYDEMGRRLSVTRGNGVATGLVFDDVSRLTDLNHNLTGTADDLSLDFAYNPAGMITSRTAGNDNGSYNSNYSWADHYNLTITDVLNGLNQIDDHGVASLAYDARGNLTSDGTSTYTYDDANRLLTATGGATFDYDALGRLFQTAKTGSTTLEFLYDGANLIAEYNTSGTIITRYVHGPGADEPIVEYDGSGTGSKTWLIADERGSIVAGTNSTGSSTYINSYDEYGQPSTGNSGRFQYTGQAYIEEADVYYYKARFYDPELGRFLQSDPIGYGAGMNMYGYVSGDPVNYKDPTGTADDEIVVKGYRLAGYPGFGGSGVGLVKYTAGRSADSSESRAKPNSAVDEIVVKSAPKPAASYGTTIADAPSLPSQTQVDEIIVKGQKRNFNFGEGLLSLGNPFTDCPCFSTIDGYVADDKIVVIAKPMAEHTLTIPADYAGIYLYNRRMQAKTELACRLAGTAAGVSAIHGLAHTRSPRHVRNAAGGLIAVSLASTYLICYTSGIDVSIESN